MSIIINIIVCCYCYLKLLTIKWGLISCRFLICECISLSGLAISFIVLIYFFSKKANVKKEANFMILN